MSRWISGETTRTRQRLNFIVKLKRNIIIAPATPGTGVIAGGPVRAIMELAGVTDVLTKSLGTNNAMNIVKAAAEGLKNMESPEQVAARRDTSVAKIYGWKEKE